MANSGIYVNWGRNKLIKYNKAAAYKSQLTAQIRELSSQASHNRIMAL
jgi:hypothetical protein